MKIFLTNQIRDLDRYTIEHEPILSVDLMERAAKSLLTWFLSNIPSSMKIVIFAGPGNNGGDGLALARMLIDTGYNVDVYYLKSENFSKDFLINLNRLKNQGIVKPIVISSIYDLPDTVYSSIIVDALFGSGISRPLEGLAAQVVEYINKIGGEVVAIDTPSGLFGEMNICPNKNPIVKAKITLTLQFPKVAFFFAENYQYVGDWIVLPIGIHKGGIEETASKYTYIDQEHISGLFNKLRGKFCHKGDFGHCLIIAGCHGMMGAGVLATKSAIKAGTGLVTTHVPRIGYSILQNSAPEAMVEIDDNDWCFTEIKEIKRFSSVGVGPGLGKSTKTVRAIRSLLSEIKSPLVIDADALNIISENKNLLDLVPENTIITPHPGEFDRLFGKNECGYNRLMQAHEISKQRRIVIVLKGAYSQIICPNGDVYFNSTGNPGMASGGSGDVLLGIIASLLSQGYNSANASIIGVYVHGLAGNLALASQSMESLSAMTIIDNLGMAFNYIRNYEKVNDFSD